METIAVHGTTFIAIAVIFGLLMTWGIGANDVANALGTSVGSGAVTVRTAIIIAAVQLVDHVADGLGIRPPEARFDEFVEFLHDLRHLAAGFETALRQGHQRGADRIDDHRAPHHQHTGDVLCGIGDRILQVEDLEKVAAVHRHEHGLGQMRAKLVLDVVCLVLESEDPVSDLLDLAIVSRAKGHEQALHFRGTSHHNAHVLLQRLERRMAE